MVYAIVRAGGRQEKVAVGDVLEIERVQAEPGATGLELLLSLALHWADAAGLPWIQALAAVTSAPARILAHGPNGDGAFVSGAGALSVGGPADVCVFDPDARWTVSSAALRSQGKHTPFAGYELAGQVMATIVAGRVAYERALR